MSDVLCLAFVVSWCLKTSVIKKNKVRVPGPYDYIHTKKLNVLMAVFYL